MGSGPRIPDKQELKTRYAGLVASFEAILDNLHHQLKAELERKSLHVTVKTRVKSFDSYYRKLLARLAEGEGEIDPGRLLSSEEGLQLTDVLGVRIVCPFLEQVQTACAVVRSLFEVIEIEEKGAERSFREFGYQSTHYLVRLPDSLEPEGLGFTPICEIQVCTLLQDAWAEVEHEIIYKAEFTPFDEPLRRKLAALNANLTLSDIIFQEIRDYQRQLHGELGRRRRDFLERVRRTNPAASDSSLHRLRSAAGRWAGGGRPGGARGRGAGGARTDGIGNQGEIGKAFAGSQERGAPEEAAVRPNGEPAVSSLDELLLKALYAHNAKEYAEAIETYTKILASSPTNGLEAIVLIHRGMAYYAGEQYDLALADFKNAIKSDPQNAKAFYYRGIVYRTKQDYRRALRDFDRSLDLNPYEFDTLISRGRVHAQLGNIRNAMEDCRNALRIEPDATEAQELLLELRERGAPGSSH